MSDEQKSSSGIEYVFSITQKTGAEQQVTMNGNIRSGESPKDVFKRLEIMTRMLDTLMKRNNYFVMLHNIQEQKKQVQEINLELDNELSPGRGSKHNREQQIKTRENLLFHIEGATKFLEAQREELIAWGAELPAEEDIAI